MYLATETDREEGTFTADWTTIDSRSGASEQIARAWSAFTVGTMPSVLWTLDDVHDLGLAVHDVPTDMTFNNTPLLDRQVFSVEPGIYEYGVGGFRLDETVVTGKTPSMLTTTPKDLNSQTIR